ASAEMIERQKWQENIKGLHTEQTLVEETSERLTGEIGKLEAKIAEARAKQQALTIRNQAASNRRDVQRHLSSGRTHEAMAKYEQYARKVDELERSEEHT